MRLREVWAGCLLLALASSEPALGGQVQILKASFGLTGAGWRVSVTLKHADAGWGHYADQWRVVTDERDVVATRVLLHPHVEEEPFTRSLFNVIIPEGTTILFVEAHDTVHGWAKERLKVDLSRARGDRFEVKRR